ncbi:polygalacturonase-1 non-catalytic subunit beta-like [Olea europaea var. sylvestris]|uniref:polygalacturonase-1 non-catalytic subunit beta-like n=1 Tax=Olea europaea var. sylvestris TaxID=158386 RepID=UPI000C1D138F|nr:polygalacturonase-1 non-catalytic subunit beta-like [Olea europaea var. sylvestris]
MVPSTKQIHQQSHSSLLSLTNKMHYILFPLFLIFTVRVEAGGESSGAGENPFTPKGYVIRYWKKQISNDLPKPLFLLNKASPLDSVQFAAFSKLADRNSLSTHLPEFCAKANLLCFPDLTPSLEKHDGDVNFAAYNDRNFTNYGTGRLGGVDSFKSYADGENIPVNTFRRYSRDSAGHNDKFNSYASNGNVPDQSFNTYGTTATGGVGDFRNYNNEVNVPNLRFTSYTDNGNGREQAFTSYSEDGNSGDQKFTNYGKNANGAPNAFTSYGKDYGKESNVIGSTFTNYGESGNGANDSFTSYGTDTNVPENTFKNYGTDNNVPVETFKSYRDRSNAGDDNFQTYGKGSNAATVDFENYGQSFNEGTDKFSTYGKDASGETVGFKIYGVNNTFKEYTKKGVTFARYNESTSATLAAESGKKVNKWVEPGKFFREEMLRGGNVMPMPDIRDKMPKRSFLPRIILSKLPFSTSKLGELKKIFHAGDDDSSMAKMLADSLSECERAPSPGETKRCVASIEDMIDFATSVLGRNVVVRTTESTRGYNSNIIIGKVKGLNGGKVTKSVSCHQSLFPYLLYYCHSVPKVRVYEADILDPNSKSKINHGVAICHLDTSSWSPDHGAFIALGSVPGKIEVCHWIFENDMTWTIGD